MRNGSRCRTSSRNRVPETGGGSGWPANPSAAACELGARACQVDFGLRRSALRPHGLLWLLLTSDDASENFAILVAQRHAARSPRVLRTHLHAYVRRIYVVSFRVRIGFDDNGTVIGVLFRGEPPITPVKQGNPRGRTGMRAARTGSGQLTWNSCPRPARAGSWRAAPAPARSRACADAQTEPRTRPEPRSDGSRAR